MRFSKFNLLSTFLTCCTCHSHVYDDRQGSLSIDQYGKIREMSSLMRRGIMETGMDDSQHSFFSDDLHNHVNRSSAAEYMSLQGLTATMSTTYSNSNKAASESAAEKALSRRRSSSGPADDVLACTMEEANPWLNVNLGSDALTVIGVRIGNRLNCCPERLNNYKLELIGDSKTVTCVSDGGTVDTTNKRYHHWCLDGGIGTTGIKNVKISLPTTQFLQVSELSAYYSVDLTASGISATQSSIFGIDDSNQLSTYAARALDGVIPNGAANGIPYNSTSCTATSVSTAPFWKATGFSGKITSVLIWNVAGNDALQLNGFKVEIDIGGGQSGRSLVEGGRNGEQWTTCVEDVEVKSGQSNPIQITCDTNNYGVASGYPLGDGSAQGVKISIPGSGKQLILCEVKLGMEVA